VVKEWHYGEGNEDHHLGWGRFFRTSSSCSYQGTGPLVDPLRSHTSRSLFGGLPLFLLPLGVYFLSICIICYVAFDLRVVHIRFLL
jgi:hypothetical protein